MPAKTKNKIIKSNISLDLKKETFMKDVTLNISERLSIIALFNQFKGGIETYKAILDTVPEISLSDAEKEQVHLVEDTEKGTVNWTEQIDKEVKIPTSVVDYLTKFIQKKSEDGEITLADAPLVSLLDKLTN